MSRVILACIIWKISLTAGQQTNAMKTAHVGDNVTLSWKVPPPGVWGYKVEFKRSTHTSKVAVLDVYDINTIEPFKNQYEYRVEYTGTLSHAGAGTLSFVLRNVTKEDTGQYLSLKYNKLMPGFENCGSGLSVLYGPGRLQFNLTNETVSAQEGGSLRVRCSADCNPACIVTWWDTSRQRVIMGQREAVLYIPVVDRSVSGQYTCHVNNTEGNSSKNLLVQVTSTVSITQFSANAKDNCVIEKGESIIFECNINSTSTPNASLKYGGITSVSMTDSLTLNALTNSQDHFFRYTIEKATCADHGVYYCRAWTQAGASSTGMVHVNVKCPPTSTHPQATELKIPSNVTHVSLNFTVVAYPAPYQTQWYFVDKDKNYIPIQHKGQYIIQHVNVSADVYHDSLCILSFSSKDYGQYMLRVDNTEGTGIFRITVSPEDGHQVYFIATGTAVPLVLIIAATAICLWRKCKTRARAGSNGRDNAGTRQNNLTRGNIDFYLHTVDYHHYDEVS